jgi:anti-anti-sigma factor
MPTRSFSSMPDDNGRPAPVPLRVDISSPGPCTVVTPVGEADICTVAVLRQALAEATGPGRSHVVVDLDQLAFMDASTLDALVEARLRLSAAGGELQVRCRNPHRRKVVSLAGLNAMLDSVG